MTIAPNSTYNSTTDLSIGKIPQVDDPELYRELLDIHNAIESLLKGSDTASAVFTAYIAKQRNVVRVTTDYMVTDLNGTVVMNAASNQVTATLPIASLQEGYMYSIKCEDDTNKAFVTTQGTETLGDEVLPFELFSGEYINVVSDGTNWLVAR